MHHDQFYHAFLIVIGLFSQPTLPKNVIYDTSTAFYGSEFNPEAVPCGTLPLKITSRTELFSFFMTKTVIETLEDTITEGATTKEKMCKTKTKIQ